MKSILALLVFTILTFNASAKALTIGVEGAYFPDNFCGTLEAPTNCPEGQTGVIRKGATTGGLNGFDIRIAEEICLKANINCKYKVVPWGDSDKKGVPAIFKRNDIDLIIAAATRRPERVKAFGPTTIRYSTDAPIRFVAKECWSDYKPADLKGKVILAQSGTIYDIFLKKRYEPEGVTIRSLTTAAEMMEMMKSDPSVDGMLVGFNGFPPKWVIDNGYHVIKPKQEIHPDFTSNHRGSFVYLHKHRLFGQKRKLLDKFNATISVLWAQSVESPESDSVVKFEKEFKRGMFNPDWQVLQERDCRSQGGKIK